MVQSEGREALGNILSARRKSEEGRGLESRVSASEEGRTVM